MTAAPTAIEPEQEKAPSAGPLAEGAAMASDTGASAPLTAPKPEAIDLIRRRLDPRLVTRGRVVFIGLGGIGLYLSHAVVTFLAGLKRALGPEEPINVLLVDGDDFSLSNTYRMEVPEFGNKAAVIGQAMLEKFDTPGLAIRWRKEFATPENIGELVGEGDLVLLACDNHATRRLVGRHCASGQFANIALISGGNDGVEDGLRGTFGNIQVYLRENGQGLTAPLDRFHPEIANPADQSPHEMSCLEMEATGVPQLSFVNMAVASAMCNALLRLLMPVPGERMYDEVALDILDAVSLPHWISGPQRRE
jgi:molybdopterin/thiamine biosynthesis adenylyltransferase